MWGLGWGEQGRWGLSGGLSGGLVRGEHGQWGLSEALVRP